MHDIVRRRGRVLIPVFALGRAQELLLILGGRPRPLPLFLLLRFLSFGACIVARHRIDEYWEANPALQHVPIYYASAMAKKC